MSSWQAQAKLPPAPAPGSYFENGAQLFRLETFSPEIVVVEDCYTEDILTLSVEEFVAMGLGAVDDERSG